MSAYKQNSFIITDNPEDIPMILLDDVELVVLKSPKNFNNAADNALKSFDIKKLNPSNENFANSDHKTLDGQRLLIPTSGEKSFSELKPVYNVREKLRRLLKKHFGLKAGEFKMSQLMVQKANRSKDDTVFHCDVSTGITKAEIRMNQMIYVSYIHKGKNTEFIPKQFAGQSVSNPDKNREVFPNPTDISQSFSGTAGDILIYKSGVNGTVHKGPKSGRGLRWWTFYHTLMSYHQIKRRMGKKKMADLQQRFDNLEHR